MFDWLTKESRLFLSRGYIKNGMEAEERYRQIADYAESILGIDEFSDKFYNYLGRGFYSLSSPVLSNFGAGRGLGISCYGSYIEDTMSGILDIIKEVGMMSKYGGGTSCHFGDIRPEGSVISTGGTSDGSVHFMRLFDTAIDVCKQSDVRRGSMAAYLPIDHPDIKRFLRIKTEGNPIQNLFTGVCVSDEWLESMKAGDEEKREIWVEVLRSRCELGIPYIFFTDTINNNTVDVFKDNNLRINASNLCSEIALPSNLDYSFVCNLSSLNIVKYEEWKDTDAVETLVYFLDAVMSDFIERAKDIPGFNRAVNFARDFRALGIGVLGWHDFLQQRMISFESVAAFSYNHQIFLAIKERCYKASKELYKMFGASDIMAPYGRRNATLNAVAPTTSSAFIVDQTSQSVEPYRSNYYVKDLAKIKTTIRNKNLEKHLTDIGKNTEDVWKSILYNNGSVQHLDFLDDNAKEVFKTFSEISQMVVVQQAAQRQVFIDQAQSINLMIHPDTPLKDINNLTLEAHKSGVKTLYYQHSINAAQEFNRELMSCVACEG